jgi:dTDP-4-amino-4,6-dideoxygalactose transaminase
LIALMKADGIGTPFHYVPLHSAPAGRKFARSCGSMQNTDDLSARLVRLPLFPKMSDEKLHVIARLQLHLDALL